MIYRGEETRSAYFHLYVATSNSDQQELPLSVCEGVHTCRIPFGLNGRRLSSVSPAAYTQSFVAKCTPCNFSHLQSHSFFSASHNKLLCTHLILYFFIPSLPYKGCGVTVNLFPPSHKQMIGSSIKEKGEQKDYDCTPCSVLCQVRSYTDVWISILMSLRGPPNKLSCQTCWKFEPKKPTQSNTHGNYYPFSVCACFKHFSFSHSLFLWVPQQGYLYLFSLLIQ